MHCQRIPSDSSNCSCESGMGSKLLRMPIITSIVVATLILVTYIVLSVLY
jgi:hypothetical protein